MWLGKENQIDIFSIVKKSIFFYFLKINFLLVIGSAFPQGNALVKLWVLELRLSGSASLMVMRAASWAMFDLRQLHGNLDRNHQEQTTHFKWRPGPLSLAQEKMGRLGPEQSQWPKEFWQSGLRLWHTQNEVCAMTFPAWVPTSFL